MRDQIGIAMIGCLRKIKPRNLADLCSVRCIAQQDSRIFRAVVAILQIFAVIQRYEINGIIQHDRIAQRKVILRGRGAEFAAVMQTVRLCADKDRFAGFCVIIPQPPRRPIEVHSAEGRILP